MAEVDIKIDVPFKSLISSVRRLRYEEKIKLLEAIEEQLEEDLLNRNPVINKEIHDAREEYRTGNYETLEEYKARNKDRLK